MGTVSNILLDHLFPFKMIFLLFCNHSIAQNNDHKPEKLKHLYGKAIEDVITCYNYFWRQNGIQ